MEKVVWEINEFESNKSNQTEARRNALIQEENQGIIMRQIAMEGMVRSQQAVTMLASTMRSDEGREVIQSLQSSEVGGENTIGESRLEDEESHQTAHLLPRQAENGPIFIDPQRKRKYQRKEHLEKEKRPRGRPRKLQRTTSGSIQPLSASSLHISPSSVCSLSPLPQATISGTPLPTQISQDTPTTIPYANAAWESSRSATKNNVDISLLPSMFFSLTEEREQRRQSEMATLQRGLDNIRTEMRDLRNGIQKTVSILGDIRDLLWLQISHNKQ